MRITKDMVFSVDRGTDAEFAQTLAVFERDGILWASGAKATEHFYSSPFACFGDVKACRDNKGCLSMNTKARSTHYTPSEFLTRFGSVDDAPVRKFTGSAIAPDTQYQPNTKSLSILREAMDIVGGARKAEYGDQRVNFQKYADIATLMLDSADLEAIAAGRIPSAVVVKVLMAVKLGRHAFKPKRDNVVDLCGYADILHTVQGG